MNTTRIAHSRKRLLLSVAFGFGIAVTGAIAATPVAAQGFTNFAATGTVVDEAGKPIAGATVTVRSVDQGFSRTATTGRDGTYQIPELPSGTYAFTVEASDYGTYTEERVPLASGNASNRFRLSSSDVMVDADITITGQRVATSDFDRTTTGSVIDVAELSTRVPVGRNIQSIIQLTPGVAPGSGAFGGLASVNGGAVSENAFYVNGLNITDFRKGLGAVEVPFDFYKTVETKTGGYAAEFGRSTGGFINATTKSGSNEFHGGVLFSWNPDELRSLAPDTRGSDNDSSKSNSRTMTAQLGGPIIKDHLFFYGLYQARDVSSSAGGKQYISPTLFRGTSRSYYSTHSPFYAGKIDAVITDGQRLEFTYFNTSGEGTNRTYGNTVTNANRFDYINNIDGPFTSNNFSSYGGENYVGRYTGVFTNWLTLSAAYGRNENKGFSTFTNATNSNAPGVVDNRNINSPTTVQVGGGSRADTLDVREFYRADADVYFKLFGSHHVKFGYDREELFSDVITVGNGGGIGYSIERSAAGNPQGLPIGTEYVAQTTYSVGGGFKSLNDAFYVQDSWSMFENRLNLSLGIRNDRFKNYNGAGELFYQSGDQWGPRIGFTIDPLGNQTDKIYGSFSRLFVPVAANTNIRLAGGEFFYTRYNLFGGLGANNVPILGSPVLYSGAAACPDTGTLNCDVTGDGTPAPTEATVAKDLKPQSVDEYILGYEKRLGSRWRIGAYFTYTKLNDVLEDVAIDAAVNNYCAANRISGCAAIWDDFHQYVLVNPGKASRITLSDPINRESSLRTVDFTAEELGYPAAVRTYKAMTFTVKREYDGKWGLDGSYTYSKTIGNYEGGVKTDNGQTDTGLTTDFDQPGLQNGTFGYSPNDRRHVVKLSGSYQLFDNVVLGLNAQAISPRRFGCIGRVPDSVDSRAGQYGAAGLYCQVNADGSINTNPAVVAPVKLIQRGSVFKSDWQFVNDVDVGFKLEIGKFTGLARVSVFNVFNVKQRLNFNEIGTNGAGTPSIFYREVTGYQAPRSVRLQLSSEF